MPLPAHSTSADHPVVPCLAAAIIHIPARALLVRGKGLLEAKVYLDVDHHWNWLSVFHGWLKAPLPDSFDSLDVQSHAKGLLHFDVLRQSARVYHQPQHHRAFVVRSASLFGILRVGRVGRLGSAHIPAYAIDAGVLIACCALAGSRRLRRVGAAAV